MRKRDIIEKLIKENKEKVSFVNNYDEIKKSLNIIESLVINRNLLIYLNI